MNNEHRLVIRLFGSMQVEWGGSAIPAPRVSKGLWLVAVLALKRGEPVSRDWLAGTLWPESDDALGTLRRTLTDLRKALGEASDLITAPSPQSLRLASESCWVDVTEFERALEQDSIESLKSAVELYRDDLLPTCTVPWVVQQQGTLQSDFLNALERLAKLLRLSGEGAQAAEYLRRGIAVDEFRESIHRQLMEALSESGEVAQAIMVFRNLRVRLLRERNARPSPETASIYHALRSKLQEASQLQVRTSTEPVVRSLPTKPINLPVSLTRFLGREVELEDIGMRLTRDRLITLTGVGGIGKTHLALQTTRIHGPDFENGVMFVELAPLSDSDQIVSTMLASVGAQAEDERTGINLLASSISDQELLVVLDNCEHLLAACSSLVKTLLTECPNLQILATSRQPLGLRGEVVLRVPPLTIPDDSFTIRSDDEIEAALLKFPAVQLFAERVSALMPSFDFSARNVNSIAHLCVQLEGIPLAIELAAARVRALSIDQISQRMKDRYSLLSLGSTGALRHQQTLGAMMEWSCELLSESEAALFRRLSVFVRGWSLEAAEGICGDEVGEPETYAGSSRFVNGDLVMDVLTQLVEKSLVHSEPMEDGTRRYRMLETVREYASSKLVASGERLDILTRHGDYFYTEVEKAYNVRKEGGEKRYLNLVEGEYENIRLALANMLTTSGGERCLWFAGHLQDYWWIRGHLIEGASVLESVLARTEALGPNLGKALALSGLGVLQWFRGKFEPAIARMEECIAIRRSLGDERGAAVTLGNLGAVFREQGDFERSRICQEESLSVLRKMNLPSNVATALTNLGSTLFHQGDLECARVYYQEAVAIRRQLGDGRGIALSLCGLGMAWGRLDEIGEAIKCLDESLALLREFNDKPNLCIALLALGPLQLQLGRTASSKASLIEALDICRETGDSSQIMALVELAALFESIKNNDLAAKLVGAIYERARREGISLAKEQLSKLSTVESELVERIGLGRMDLLKQDGTRLDFDEVCLLIRK